MNFLKKPSEYRLIIFDFHKTLTDSVYFDHFDKPVREAISDLIFRPPNSDLWDRRWMSGQLEYSDILDHIAENLAIPYDRLKNILYDGIRSIRWNRNIWDFSQSIRGISKTAIATINNDLFSHVIKSEYCLEKKFDLILNSYELDLTDKTEICNLAAENCGLCLSEDPILLIDDREENIRSFIDAGGDGYLYQSDSAFKKWLEEVNKYEL